MILIRVCRLILAAVSLVLLSAGLGACDSFIDRAGRLRAFHPVGSSPGHRRGGHHRTAANRAVHGMAVRRIADRKKGQQFETSRGREPLVFTLGASEVIAGWDVELIGLRVGGLRRLIIPPSLAYGGFRNGPIPPNATLVFEVELLEVQ